MGKLAGDTVCLLIFKPFVTAWLSYLYRLEAVAVGEQISEK